MTENTVIQPGEVYAVAIATLPPEQIDSHFSDLYIKVTPTSKSIINRLQKDKFGRMPALLSTFKSPVDGCRWYCLPFCYIPYFEKGRG